MAPSTKHFCVVSTFDISLGLFCAGTPGRIFENILKTMRDLGMLAVPSSVLEGKAAPRSKNWHSLNYIVQDIRERDNRCQSCVAKLQFFAQK